MVFILHCCGTCHEIRVAEIELVHAAKNSSCCDRHIFSPRDLEGTEAPGNGGFPTKHLCFMSLNVKSTAVV
jgi:hypothetical protein